MARPDRTISLCDHLHSVPEGASYPFLVEMVLDEHLGMTDAIVRCGRCRAVYLIELVEWPTNDAHVRRFRTSVVEEADWARLHHDSQRAYCDLERMRAELHALQTHAVLSPWLIELDVRARTLISCRRAATADIPTGSWRDMS